MAQRDFGRVLKTTIWYMDLKKKKGVFKMAQRDFGLALKPTYERPVATHLWFCNFIVRLFENYQLSIKHILFA